MYQKWIINKEVLNPIYIWTCIINWKIVYLKKLEKLLLCVYWRKRVGKCSNTFGQLLIYWKIRVCRNKLKRYKIRFLICLFKLPSITLSWVITAEMFSSRVKLLYSGNFWSCYRREHQIYYIFYSRHNQLKTRIISE